MADNEMEPELKPLKIQTAEMGGRHISLKLNDPGWIHARMFPIELEVSDEDERSFPAIDVNLSVEEAMRIGIWLLRAFANLKRAQNG